MKQFNYNYYNPPQGQQSTKLFVGGLSYQTTDETFLQYFSNFGYVKKATIMKSADQTSRGFGFVTFEDPYVASYVVCMKDHMIDGRRVDIRWALSKEMAPPPQQPDNIAKKTTNKIFVGGLHFQVTKEDLYAYFSQFGEVESAAVMIHHSSNKSRGFGFVIYKDKESVDRVLKIPFHSIMNRKVEVKVAIPKSETETPPPPSTSQENESERTSLETSSVQSKESNEGNENLEKSPLSDSSNEIKPPPLPSREVMFQSPLRSQTTFHPSLSQGPPRQSPSLSHSINLGASSYHYHSYGTDSVPLPPSRSLSSSLHGYDAPYKRGNYSIPNLSSFKDSPDLRPQYSSYNGVNNDYSNGFFSNSFEKGSRSLYSSNGYEYPYVSREDLNPSIPLSTSQEIYPERPYSANLSSFGETPHTSLPSAFETELLPSPRNSPYPHSASYIRRKSPLVPQEPMPIMNRNSLQGSLPPSDLPTTPSYPSSRPRVSTAESASLYSDYIQDTPTHYPPSRHSMNSEYISEPAYGLSMSYGETYERTPPLNLQDLPETNHFSSSPYYMNSSTPLSSSQSHLLNYNTSENFFSNSGVLPETVPTPLPYRRSSQEMETMVEPEMYADPKTLLLPEYGSAFMDNGHP